MSSPVSHPQQTTAARREKTPAEWRLIAFALLGPLFLYGLTAALMGSGGALIWYAITSHHAVYAAFKLGLPLLFVGLMMLWAVIRSRPSEEPRLELSREDAPQLWAMTEDIADKLNAPAITSLRMSADYNASALLETSRLPFIGKHKAIVTIGLPLMLSLDADELRAVLAHEIGHISRNHSRAAIWIWRAMAHGQAMYEATNGGWASALIVKFYGWYAPRLNRMGARFSRQQEFEADAASAFIAGNGMAARALIATSAREVFYAKVMDGLQETLTSANGALPDIFDRLRAAFQDEATRREMITWLSRALNAEPDEDDSHPVLAGRLAALGVDPRTVSVPPLPLDNALDALFGARAQDVQARMLEVWRGDMAPFMDMRREQAGQMQAEIRKLRTQIGICGPSVLRNLSLAIRLFQRARYNEAIEAIRDIGKPLEALPAYAQAINGAARMWLGDARGVHDIFSACGRNPQIMSFAAREVSQWLDGPGARHDSPALRKELARFEKLNEDGMAEREEVSGKTRLAPIELSDEEMQGLLAALKPHRDAIRAVWIAGRACETLPAWRHLEILIEFRPRFWLWAFDGRAKMARVLQEINGALPEFYDFSYSLRPWPFFVKKGFVTRMRKLGRKLELEDTPAPASNTATAARPGGHVPVLSVPVKPEKKPRKPLLGRALKPLGGGLVMASLALPAIIGWKVFVNNSATHARLETMDRQYAREMQNRPWRKEAEVDTESPAKTVAAYFAARRAHDASPFLPIYTRATQAMLRNRHVTDAAMDAEARAYAACGKPDIMIKDEYAIARYAPGERRCPPIFLQKEDGRWRIDLAIMSDVIGFGRKGHWHFRKALPTEYAFAFSSWSFDRNGYPFEG